MHARSVFQRDGNHVTLCRGGRGVIDDALAIETRKGDACAIGADRGDDVLAFPDPVDRRRFAGLKSEKVKHLARQHAAVGQYGCLAFLVGRPDLEVIGRRGAVIERLEICQDQLITLDPEGTRTVRHDFVGVLRVDGAIIAEIGKGHAVLEFGNVPEFLDEKRFGSIEGGREHLRLDRRAITILRRVVGTPCHNDIAVGQGCNRWRVLRAFRFAVH